MEVDIVVDKVLGAAGLNVVGIDDAGTSVVGTADAVTDDTGINVVGTAVNPVVEPLPGRS